MSGTNPVGTHVVLDRATQTPAAYASALDNNAAAAKRFIDDFAPHETYEGSPLALTMKITLDAGAVWDGTTLTEVAAQVTTALAAPAANPRIDRIVVDGVTGIYSIIAGTEAASPTAPAIISGKIPVAQVRLTVGMTTITNQAITDERPLGVGASPAIRSNIVVFTVPPNVVASAGGAGNQIRTAAVGPAGALEFNKTLHGRLDGEVVQLTTSNTLPGNTALATSYIVRKFSADNFGLYVVPAGWRFEQPYLDAVGNPGGLTWGNPIQYSSAGVGDQTVTPGFVAPVGVTRAFVRLSGGGGGGGGSRGSTGDGGTGGTGGTTTFSTLSANPGVGGTGGTATRGGNGGQTGASSGGIFPVSGNAGSPGNITTLAGSYGGHGGKSQFGGAARTETFLGSGGFGGDSNAANQGSGGGGASGGDTQNLVTLVSGTWVAATCGGSGSSGAAGTGTNSAIGVPGAAGVIEIRW